jgi:Zn-dependent M28 family amino/carboxypeptidase
MNNPIETDDLRLLEYVKALENQSNLLGINNIVVDLAPGKEGKVLLFSAHFDAVKGSPGANDNASGVAVLLGLCQRPKNVRIPVRVIFFDAEEGWLQTRFIKLGIVGSAVFHSFIQR